VQRIPSRSLSKQFFGADIMQQEKATPGQDSTQNEFSNLCRNDANLTGDNKIKSKRVGPLKKRIFRHYNHDGMEQLTEDYSQSIFDIVMHSERESKNA